MVVDISVENFGGVVPASHDFPARDVVKRVIWLCLKITRAGFGFLWYVSAI